MNGFARLSILFLTVVLCFSGPTADARRKHGKKRQRGPLPIHPVVLWSKTILAESSDREQRKVAAFKLSQYSQTLYQDIAVTALTTCAKDPDTEIRVLCTVALGRAGTRAHADKIRQLLLEIYSTDAELKNTVIRTLIRRKDNHPKIYSTLLGALKAADDDDDALTLLGYFQEFGSGNNEFVEAIAEVYKNHSQAKVRRLAVKVLADRAQGQGSVVEIMASCANNRDTPLALNCLYGLQLQARKDARAWQAVEKSVNSDDPDVLMASLDVINTLPETTNAQISQRLVTIIEDMEDPEIRERAILALGVCGDGSEGVLRVLRALSEDDKKDESLRIAGVLVLGKQGQPLDQDIQNLLATCAKSAGSQSLRTACQLSSSELNRRAKTTLPKPDGMAEAAKTISEGPTVSEAPVRKPSKK